MHKVINFYKRNFTTVILPSFAFISVSLFMNEFRKIFLCILYGMCVATDVYACLIYGFGSCVSLLCVLHHKKCNDIQLNQNITRDVQNEPEHRHRQRPSRRHPLKSG